MAKKSRHCPCGSCLCGSRQRLSVAAAQNTSLLEKLFPWAESVDVPETAVFTNGQIESFTVDGMDGLDITPVGVVNDAKNVYLMMRIVPSDPDFNPAKERL